MEKTFEKVWEDCLKIIRECVDPNVFKTWFEPIKPVKLESNVLMIQVPSHFYYEYLEQVYIDVLRLGIRKQLGPEGRLEYSILMDNKPDDANSYSMKVPPSNPKLAKNPAISLPFNRNNGEDSGNIIKNPFVLPGLKKITIDSQLNEIYNFDNYIEGSCNKLAREAGLVISDNPGKSNFNPLLVYSDAGLGKTHLAQAIGIKIKNKFPSKTVLYVTADKFISQFIDAVKSENASDFVCFYQMIDTLIIDDVQFFAGHGKKTQEVFFNIFNELHQKNKQIILTSDKPPVDLVGLDQRLLSRFKWGLTVDLLPPDFETRVAILKKKSYSNGIDIPQDVIEYIAFSITSNMRELEGALNSLLAHCILTKKEINIALAKQIIEKFVSQVKPEISFGFIQKTVCEYFGVPLETINSNIRKREVVQVRQIAMYFAKKYTKLSLTAIGAYCGNKDHATVLHSCKTINNLLDTDKNFKNYIEDIDKKINFQT